MAKTKRKVYIDIHTKNKSFLLTYLELKNLGIKNNRFFLRLYDKDLVGVDPYDEDLSDVYKAKIIKEVARNPWYFYREVSRIEVPGGISGFKLHRGNLALLWSLHKCINTILLLPRQNFKTMSSCCFYSYVYDIKSENSTFTFTNKEFPDAKLNVKRLKDTRNLLPSYLVMRDPKDNDNIEYISNVKKGNTVRAIPPGTDAISADKKGRGLTSPNQWYDELAFLKFNKEMYMSASPAFSQAKIEAKANGNTYAKLITTTPKNCWAV